MTWVRRRRYRPDDPAKAAVAEHHREFFASHSISVRRWPHGSAEQRLPGFFVHEVGPGPRHPGWTYLSVGAWSAAHDAGGHGVEFLVSADRPADHLVELVTMAAYYHAGPATQRLGLGHTVPIGRPWFPGSECDHELVGLPYAFGPDLEWCVWDGGHAQILELLPITRAERDFKAEQGAEALEQRLEDAGAHTTDPFRPSVV